MSIHPFITIQELEKKLAQKEITREEILEFYLRRFEAFDGEIGSALEIFDTQSILNKTNRDGNELFGIPGLIKDNICQQDRITSCASKILENFVATYDATAIARLKNAGALLIGRANMDEFAMGSSTETSAFQKTHNPWDKTCVPGGSSGGSAAAVAAGLVPWALGSETGGSVNQPSALCGIVGLKPTYGLVSRYGLVAYGSSVDQIGIMARTVYDNARVLSVIAGKDDKDASMQQTEKKDYTKNLTGVLPKNLRIGVVDNALHAEGVETEIVSAIEAALKIFETDGASIKHMQLPTLDYAAATYFILSRAEAASNLARFDGVRYGLRDKKAPTLSQMYFNTRHDGFGEEVRSRILVGNYVLSAGHAGQFYNNAQKVQRLISHEFKQAFADVDVLIMPVHPAPAFKFGAFADDKLKMDLQDYFTCAMNLAGITSLSLPCGISSGNMPIGFQIAGPHLSEELLYQVGHAFQQKTDWHTKTPPGY
ncbi:MAG TPA: Asp-tRNA(Asn)/Glu-tRNA(Gln) amidotransferase subunit GatA [Candidatus Babeliales bacterium]|jgi:aspartyl-tRNA(Asn)/glutamyl-tRNA(Gln) amidotransferase subunit A|nr:Asp-tRNA(Asn)/Glu-tRNA(Gln) amidotransferase subunit GatA [Candidatus Babeliales bacterium]